MQVTPLQTQKLQLTSAEGPVRAALMAMLHCTRCIVCGLQGNQPLRCNFHLPQVDRRHWQTIALPANTSRDCHALALLEFDCVIKTWNQICMRHCGAACYAREGQTVKEQAVNKMALATLAMLPTSMHALTPENQHEAVCSASIVFSIMQQPLPWVCPYGKLMFVDAMQQYDSP